jgi:hypothetical protein
MACKYDRNYLNFLGNRQPSFELLAEFLRNRAPSDQQNHEADNIWADWLLRGYPIETMPKGYGYILTKKEGRLKVASWWAKNMPNFIGDLCKLLKIEK